MKIGKNANWLQIVSILKTGDRSLTDLRRRQALLGQLVDMLLHVLRGQLEPVGNGAAVGEGTLRDTLAVDQKTNEVYILQLN